MGPISERPVNRLVGVKGLGKKRLFAVAVFLSALLVVSVVFGSSFVAMTGRLLFNSAGSSGSASASSTATVFVNPAKVINSRLQAMNASKFVVSVNVSGVADLFSWQINMTWNRFVLNVSRIFAGEFLLRTGSVDKTASYQLGYVINATDNPRGSVAVSDSILGSVPGISGSGRLFSVEFLVVGYGFTNLTISLVGQLKTTLLNSTTLPSGQPGTISFAVVNGYFRNCLLGDVNADRVVDVFDVLKVKYHRSGPPSGPGGYLREADINDDGTVDVFDLLIVKANLGKSI